MVESDVPAPMVMTDTGWGLEARTIAPAQHNGASRYEGVIETPADVDRIQTPRVTIDWDATDRTADAAREIFGDLLDVQISVYWGNNHGLAPMDTLAMWRGFDRLFIDLVEDPELVHRAMSRIVDGHIAIIEQLEQQNALRLNNGRGAWVGTGTIGHTDQLPAPDFDPAHVRPRDLWGTGAAQIFAQVSPDMHDEFCLQHERRYLDRFGFVCYGCCEPLHHKLRQLKRLPNLRRVSISPWANVAMSAEELGSDYVFSWKPNPAIVAGLSWDPEAARHQIREFCRKTRSCVTEIVLKDLETCAGEPQRLTEWLGIAREVVEVEG